MEVVAASESTPAKSTPNNDIIRWRDLPNKDQLFLLALCRLSEPLSNVCLLPYIFYLVRSTLPPSPPSTSTSTPDNEKSTAAQIARSSGLLVASFPLAQCLVSLLWGRLSDHFGRRPTILCGVFVSAVANAGFGLSRSFGALVFWRAVAGLANGNVGVMRTMTAEVVGDGSDPRYRTMAFLLLPLIFNAGMVLSLALGGCLADPAVNLPGLFGPMGLFNMARNPGGVEWVLEYPYALPALFNAFILAAALFMAVLGLRETLPGKEGYNDWGLRAGRALWRLMTTRLRGSKDRGSQDAVSHEYTITRDSEESAFLNDDDEHEPDPDSEKQVRKSTTKPAQAMSFRAIWTRRVVTSLVSFGLLPLHNAAFMHILPIYLSSPQTDNANNDNGNDTNDKNRVATSLFIFSGGLGLQSSTIGLWLAIFGIGGILLQLFAYPRLQRRIGTRGVFRIALFLFPVTYAAAPYLSLLADNDNGVMKWVFLGLVVCAQIMARTMAIPSTVILLTEAAPARTVLGTVHGAGNMLASLARAVGPAVGGYVFAVGVEEGIVGLGWWAYLVIVALCALAWSYLADNGTY